MRLEGGLVFSQALAAPERQVVTEPVSILDEPRQLAFGNTELAD